MTASILMAEILPRIIHNGEMLHAICPSIRDKLSSIRFMVYDKGDSIYDSAVLLDGVSLK